MSYATTEARVITRDSHNSQGFTDDNSLAKALLTKPDSISPVITHLAGKEDAKFPLTFMTEGQVGGVQHIEINDVQYTWDTFKRLRKWSEIHSTTYSSTDKPGVGHSTFYVKFKDNFLIKQHTVVSPDGTRARIMGDPTPVTVSGAGTVYEYALQLFTTSDIEYVNFTELQAGTKWAMEGGANVSNELSFGNKSNVSMPGKMKNQIGIIRKSYTTVGNMANKVVECTFNVDGKPTKYWMDFENWQHQINWRQDCEENLWYSSYNRLPDGTIKMIDRESGYPIPTGAGVVDQIPNMDTYSVLTAKKLDSIVLDTTYGATDAPTEFVLYTGIGGARAFNDAMMEMATNGVQIIGDKFIDENGDGLSYGRYFNRYKTREGKIITVKLLNLLDHGSRAQIARKHAVTGLPLTSYEMYFIDQSTYDGQRNIVTVTQKGRHYVEGIEKGMAALREMNIATNLVSTEQDKSSVHMMTVKGVCIRKNTHCFKLSCDMAA